MIKMETGQMDLKTKEDDNEKENQDKEVKIVEARKMQVILQKRNNQSHHLRTLLKLSNEIRSSMTLMILT